jgi:hypothetical protein
MTDKAREALAELVALKDLRKSLARANHHAARFPTDENYAVVDQLQTDLGRRDPLAWSAARAALAEPSQPAGRVPLTEREIQFAFDSCFPPIDTSLTPIHITFARAIEAAHGICHPARLSTSDAREHSSGTAGAGESE